MNRKGFTFYPEQYFDLTDFSAVLEMIASHCNSTTAKTMAFSPEFYLSAEKITEAHIPVKETLSLLEAGANLPGLDFFDNRETIVNLKTKDWVIDTESLQHLKILLQVYNNLLHFLSEHQKAVYLNETIQSVIFHKHLLLSIEKITDDDGNIRDDASEELVRLHREHVKIAKDIEKRLYSIFKDLKFSGITAEDTNMTIRNGRSVIPVPAHFKNKVRGIIHDESSTGQTAYIEPMEIVEMGNRLRENVAAKQREIRRILREISSELHIYIADILQYYDIIAGIDLCFAKAKFAVKHKAIIPVVKNEPVIDWKKSRNIVLEQFLQRNGKKIIPLDIQLGKEKRMLILSGANAGGKSVVIKTVALLQTMIQCGLPVPFAEHSTAGIFHSVLLDIGDGQSIESDLSTFSSHLETMKVFINKADSKCMYLIDEIGTGTDPVLGGSLAQAILLYLHQTGAYGIVTTHLDNLKKMADVTPMAGNAAMIFDTEKLEPSYILKSGIPGNSFTFEIAKRIGIPDNIIDEAKRFAGNERITFEQKISDVEKKAIQLQEGLQRQQMAEDFLGEMITKYSGLIEKIEKLQSEIIEKTKTQAAEIISKANRTIENTIRKIRESSAEKEASKAAREETRALEGEIKELKALQTIPDHMKKHIAENTEQPKTEDLPVKFSEGMRVKHKINGMEGTVLEMMADQRIKVAFNSVALILPEALFLPASVKTANTLIRKVNISSDYQQKAGLFSKQLDIRGMKPEDVMYILEKHIDDALLIGVYGFSILHGKGYGVLRNVTRQLLAKHPNIESFESEHVEAGGDGITIVRLKR
jgi:DNA mismatch repair protein MutS2